MATGDQKKQAKFWLEYSQQLSATIRYTEALTAVERSLALDDMNMAAWYARGTYLAMLARYDEALAAFEQTIAMDDTYAPAWDGMAWALGILGRRDEALAAVNRALELDPEYFDAPWLRKRLVRLARPIIALVAVWIPVTVALIAAGVSSATIHTLLFLVISPLWFLGVYAGLTALTPAAMWLVRRFGAWAAAFPAGLADSDPTAWVIANTTGGPVLLYRGKDKPPAETKTLPAKWSAGGLLGKRLPRSGRSPRSKRPGPPRRSRC